jgi:hypothetical protein
VYHFQGCPILPLIFSVYMLNKWRACNRNRMFLSFRLNVDLSYHSLRYIKDFLIPQCKKHKIKLELCQLSLVFPCVRRISYKDT